MGGPGSGRRAYPGELVAAAETLLAEGRSTYDVARALSIDRRTVRRIRDGQHARQLELRGGEPRRCACGALTYEQPCLACRLRRAGL